MDRSKMLVYTLIEYDTISALCILLAKYDISH